MSPLCAQFAETNPPPDTLAGTWMARVKLEEHGVQPFATLIAEAWGNVSGGLTHKSWVNSLLDFGAKLDTAKLGWWQGGTFMAQGHWVENLHSDACFGDYTGAFNPVSNIGAGDHLRVFNLYYQHSWADDVLTLKLGQIAVDDDFMTSDYSGLFLNSAFGAMPSQVGTPLSTACGGHTAFPIYAVAAPGIFLSAQPHKSIYSRVGLYHGTPGFDERNNYGFDWANETFREVGLFWESGYSYKISNRAATSRLGLSYHTGPLDNFSARAEQSSNNPQSVPNFYVIHDQQLLAGDDGKTVVGAFCRGGVTPEPQLSLVAWYADAGVNWFGPIPHRSEDVAGVAISHTRFGREFRRSTGPDGIASGETTLELTYRAQLSAWFAIQADLQLLFDPAANPRSGSRETATVLGLRAEIRF